MNLKQILLNKEISGEIGKNIGLGIFVNALYSISDGSIEFYNVIDIIIGLTIMIIGIILERK